MNQADTFLNERNQREDITAGRHYVGDRVSVPEALEQSCKNSNTSSAKTAGGWFSFRGRACRKEWWIQSIVANIPIFVYFAVLEAAKAERYENDAWLTLLMILFPCLVAAAVCFWAVTVRRLHDRGKSGMWVLLFIVLNALPIVNMIAQIVVLGCMDGQPFANKYGPDPKGRNRQP